MRARGLIKVLNICKRQGIKKTTFALSLGFLLGYMSIAYAANYDFSMSGNTYLATESGSVGIGTTEPGRLLS